MANIFQTLIEAAGKLVNVSPNSKNVLQQIQDDFKATFKFNKPDLDIGRRPGTQILVVELNHLGVEAQAPFAQNVAELAHNFGVGKLEGDEINMDGVGNSSPLAQLDPPKTT